MHLQRPDLAELPCICYPALKNACETVGLVDCFAVPLLIHALLEFVRKLLMQGNFETKTRS